MTLAGGTSVIDLFVMPLPHAGGAEGGQESSFDPQDADSAVAEVVSPRYLIIYKAEANRCGKGYNSPLEWSERRAA